MQNDKQTWNNFFEYNSLEILEEYAKKDDRIKIINQENKKQGAARNRGIEIVQGEFIGFVDSDDWVDLDYFEKLYTTALEYQSDVAVASVLKHKKNYQKYNVYYKNIKYSDKLQERIKPTWFIDRLIYTYPLMMAEKFNTPLLVYGENVSHEYGGGDDSDTYSAKGILANGVASDMNLDEIIDATGVAESELYMMNMVTKDILDKIDPIYISYFIPWNSFENEKIAKAHGFRDLSDEWRRQHFVEDMDQIDSRAYLVHPWLKYPKFGHQFATDYASRMVRYGMITRDEAIELVKRHDAFLDPLCVRDFCEFCGYTKEEFWAIVDKLYNPDLFEKDIKGKWKLKYDIAETK